MNTLPSVRPAKAPPSSPVRDSTKPRIAPVNKHDFGHDFELFECCWCMCVKCWLRYRTQGLGRCICPQCPCNVLF